MFKWLGTIFRTGNKLTMLGENEVDELTAVQQDRFQVNRIERKQTLEEALALLTKKEATPQPLTSDVLDSDVVAT